MKFKKVDPFALALTQKTTDHSVYTLEVGGLRGFIPLVHHMLYGNMEKNKAFKRASDIALLCEKSVYLDAQYLHLQVLKHKGDTDKIDQFLKNLNL
tara:strand:+ start:918 stop:1205 length:288 start_codon:yes stop_codon:yes gene_type:complete